MDTNQINEQLLSEAKEFLIESFTENPSYSFGDASIMIEHSLNVSNLCINLSIYTECDPTTVAIGGMFHDIGKAMTIGGEPINWESLRKNHEAFNMPMMLAFFKSRDVEGEIVETLHKAFDEESGVKEGYVIKDADLIEFYMNYRLQKALKEWGDKMGFPNELQRKADKFNTVMKFDKSKEMAKPFWETMKLRWNLN
jgi:putative nucleotidyltransferase with HDIG domain